MLPDRYFLYGLLKRFVQQHDGRVKVMQSIQTSTCFEEEEKRAERPVVLVIDDQPAILDMLSWMLSFHGYQAVCIANGQEALEWMKSALHTGQYPVVIILDLFMPVMNGAKFLACLRDHWNAPVPIPPIILLTVDKSNHDHLACSDVLLKPFHIKDLRESLKQIIGKEPVSC
jgi:CheY-like chemotaxis protein